MNKQKSIYLIEICDVGTDEDGLLQGIELISYYYCETEEEAKVACDRLNKTLEPYQSFKVSTDNFKYPFYRYDEVPKYNI